MMPNEKDQLLALFESERCWCQGAEAIDAQGVPVKFHDPEAVAWDLTGALCRLFGWPRARVLFRQLDRHLFGKRRVKLFDRDPAVRAMVALQEFNDRSETTFETLSFELRNMPTWHGSKREQPAHDG